MSAHGLNVGFGLYCSVGRDAPGVCGPCGDLGSGLGGDGSDLDDRAGFGLASGLLPESGLDLRDNYLP